MNIACVIGNGVTRLNFDLSTIGRKMTTYGCNALYRDYTPDYLISIDASMMDEILKEQVYNRTKFYCQKNNRTVAKSLLHPIYFLDTQNWSMDSGNHAILVACKDSNKIYIIGFDYLVDGELTNVYADTRNYGQVVRTNKLVRTTDKRYSNLSKIITMHPNIEFIRVNYNNDDFNIDLPNFTQIDGIEFKGVYQ